MAFSPSSSHQPAVITTGTPSINFHELSMQYRLFAINKLLLTYLLHMNLLGMIWGNTVRAIITCERMRAGCQLQQGPGADSWGWHKSREIQHTHPRLLGCTCPASDRHSCTRKCTYSFLSAPTGCTFSIPVALKLFNLSNTKLWYDGFHSLIMLKKIPCAFLKSNLVIWTRWPLKDPSNPKYSMILGSSQFSHKNLQTTISYSTFITFIGQYHTCIP